MKNFAEKYELIIHLNNIIIDFESENISDTKKERNSLVLEIILNKKYTYKEKTKVLSLFNIEIQKQEGGYSVYKYEPSMKFYHRTKRRVEALDYATTKLLNF